MKSIALVLSLIYLAYCFDEVGDPLIQAIKDVPDNDLGDV